MTLKDVLDVYGVGCYLHIGTEYGDRWLWTGITSDAYEKLQDLHDRKVVNTYYHEGRGENGFCCELKPGLAVIVEGSERGIY